MAATTGGPDYTLFAGEDKVLTITVSVDITGSTQAWTLLKGTFDRTTNLTIAGVITDAANGIFTVTLTAAQTAVLSGEYTYVCIVTDSSSNDTYVVTGTLTARTYSTEYAYCSLYDVRNRCQQLVLSSTTSPTEDDAQRYVLDTYHEINAVLQAQGYAVPIPVESSNLNAGSGGTITVSGAHTATAHSILLVGSGGTLVGVAGMGDWFTIAGDATHYNVLGEKIVNSTNKISLDIAPSLRIDAADAAAVTYHSNRGSHELLRSLNADGAASKVLLAAFGHGSGQVTEDQQEYSKMFNDKLKMISSGKMILSGIARTSKGGFSNTPLRRR